MDACSFERRLVDCSMWFMDYGYYTIPLGQEGLPVSTPIFIHSYMQ